MFILVNSKITMEKHFIFILFLGIFIILEIGAKSLDSAQDKEPIPEGQIEQLDSCSKPQYAIAKEICEDVCGQDSCRSRQNEEGSYLPVPSFCACFKMPEYNENYVCGPNTENETLWSLCQATCPMIFDPEDNDLKFTDFYCKRQTMGENDNNGPEMCTCVPNDGSSRPRSTKGQECSLPSSPQCHTRKGTAPTCLHIC